LAGLRNGKTYPFMKLRGSSTSRP